MKSEVYSEVLRALRQSNVDELETLCKMIENFPHGKDTFIERHWITNAIDCGSIETVMWILSKNVELRFRNDEGYTPLHSAMERGLPNKYEVFQALIDAGADVNAHGPNDYTPLHSAIMQNDLRALRILLHSGADRKISTRIDYYETPIEMAYRHSSISHRRFNKEIYELLRR